MSDEQKPSEIAGKIVGNIQKNFKIVGSHRVHSWYAWAMIGIVFGMALGVVYVANRSGKVNESSANGSTNAVTYACPSTTEVSLPGIGVIYPLPYSDPPKNLVIGSNTLRKVVSNISAMNKAVDAGKNLPKQTEETTAFINAIRASDTKAFDLCLEDKKRAEAEARATCAAKPKCIMQTNEVPADRSCKTSSELINQSKDSAPITLATIFSQGNKGVKPLVVDPGEYVIYTKAYVPGAKRTISCVGPIGGGGGTAGGEATDDQSRFQEKENGMNKDDDREDMLPPQEPKTIESVSEKPDSNTPAVTN